MLLIFGLLGYAHAATTTVTGTINDLTGAAVTSGQVTFELKPGLDTTISGSARFVPSTVTCYINGSGVIKGDVAFATSCTVVQNTSLTPNGTYYLVCLWPSNTKTSCFNWYALASSFDITTAVPTPATSPAFTFADLVSNQTIGGNKTASGSWTFTPEATFNGGIKALFVESQSTPSTSGFIRAGNAECFKFRNAGNSADVNGLCMNGSNQVTLGSGPFVIPAVSDTAVGKATTDTLTNKTLTSPAITSPVITSPVINGSPTGTGIPILTLKKGSGAGNYTSASTTYVRVDSTNLAYTVTIPTGWKLTVQASGAVGTATAAVTYSVALADGSADNTGIVAEIQGTASGASVVLPFSLSWVVTGDGASHTINLQYKTSVGADSVVMGNPTSTFTPAMTFNLSPSQ